MLRKIVTYSTIAENQKEILSSASTWGELQIELRTNGIRFEDMTAVVGENQNSLESSQAVLPEGPFSLFLMPKKVKSGNDDDDLIDEFDGISHTDEDWDSLLNFPEDHSFISERDLAIARFKKAMSYLRRASAFLESNNLVGNSDDDNLKKMAEQIKKNFNY